MDWAEIRQETCSTQQGVLVGAMPYSLRLVYAFFAITLLCSCAGPQALQPRLNSLMAQKQYDNAIQALDSNSSMYGPKNELLFLLDHGFLFHLAGRYQESIEDFEKAKRLYDDLYGHTFSEVAGSLLVNDNWKAYRGEDYEYILVNLFQALNYAAIGRVEESTADIRNIDNQFKLINSRYKENQKNVYRDDAFARLLGGIFFEIQGDSQDLNDAYISNVKALNVYEHIYTKSYGQGVPVVLKQNLLTTARFMGNEEFHQYSAKLGDIKLSTTQEKQKKAEVYLIEYTGFSPVKVDDSVIVPIDSTHIIRLSFPRFVDRYSQTQSSLLVASSIPGVEIVAPTEVVEDVGSIAKAVLHNQIGLVMAQALLRPLGKYVIQKSVEESLRSKHKDTAADIVTVLGDIYNVVSERADLRSWETLPGQIRMARLLLDPGQYKFIIRDYNGAGVLVEEKSLGDIELQAGQKKFMISRCYK